jgi:phospholipid/cholesterol/gamma-HCH transport system permease protein
MVPILTLMFNVIGMCGAYVVCVKMLGIDPGVFVGRMQWLVDWPDVMQGLIKAFIFGGTICLIACRQGFYATGGAAGVGRATNRSVVHSAVAILALDYLVTAMVLGQGLF